MEMVVIAVIVLAAFAAVLVPLFRRRPGSGDEREFENIPPAHGETTDPARGEGVVPPMAGGPATPVAPMAPAPAPATGSPDGDTLEAEVLRYREAVRAGTVCRKCGEANPSQSLYCSDCGAQLPRADAKEFE